MKMFKDKVVIITGASSGIGKAAALKFAKEGAKVVLAARREDKGLAVMDQIKAQGGEAVFIKTDVTKREDIEAMVKCAIEKYGRLDCAVNNAGIPGTAMIPVADIEEEDWDAVLNTNLKAVWMCMKYQIREMLKQGSGSIVNISSIYGFKANDLGNAQYCASKFGVVGLSKTAAIDYAQQGIRVNVVAPGITHSEIVTPFVESAPDFVNAVVNRHSAINRVAKSEEVAEATAWLCSDSASFVNGVVLPVNGGDAAKMY